MNRDHCREIEELLVDLADGILAGEETTRVRSHLERCPHCRETFEALGESLQCAEAIWQHHLNDERAARTGSRRVWRYLAFAAGILLVCGAALFWPGRADPPAEAPTLAEIEQRIATAGTAARLLAATGQLETQASLRDVAENQYRYILTKYPDTEAAIQARRKLESYR